MAAGGVAGVLGAVGVEGVAVSRSDRTYDPVNHPAHYASGEIECIDAIRAALGLDGFVAHCRGTAIKYAWRAGKKGCASECLRKGAWYLTKAAEALEADERPLS